MTPATQKTDLPLAAAKPWLRYTVALAASILTILLIVAANRLTESPISPFLPGTFAVLASAAWGGFGPGIVSVVMMTLFSAVDLTNNGISNLGVLVRCSAFICEGLLLCFGSLRMLRSARQAAAGEAWHRQLVETAMEGIWIQDAFGTITYANARMAEMLGVPHDGLMGRKTDEFFFPADLSMERIRALTLSSGVNEQFDRRLRRADGGEMWVLACCNLMPAHGAATPGSALAMMMDITERKKAEHELRRSEERFRSLFESVLEGVYQSTPDGRILAANPMLLKMLGLNREAELTGVHIAKDLYVDAGVRKRLLAQLERDGSFQNVEYELRARDGRILSVLENARVVRDDKGEVLYYEGTLIDVTNRKRIEEQLRQAQKVEALGRLAGGIARDFDLILNVITGHVQATLDELPPLHSARGASEQALSAAASARALTAQLLSFSRRPTDEATPAAARTSDGPESGNAILLVEDEPLLRELSRDMLERQGFIVTSAAGSDEAIRLGGNGKRFDLMITDFSMPNISGIELAKRMRSAQPGIKVLFISGYSDTPVNRESLGDSESAVLARPYSADSLGRKIRALLQEQTRANSAGT